MANTSSKAWWIYRIKNPLLAIKDAHGMVLLDDFTSVQNIINASDELPQCSKTRHHRQQKSLPPR
jgi:Cu2+-containing amine oxidase